MTKYLHRIFTRKALLLLATMLTTLTSHADEGMWTLYNLPDAVYQQMQAEGFQLPKTALYSEGRNILANDSSTRVGDKYPLSSAVVNFSGYCTGVVVSPDGLVMTNHHCGFESIRSHSTVEHDYMINGFFAKTKEEELPNEDMFVAFMVKQEDITSMLDSLGINDMEDWEQDSLLTVVENSLSKEARKVNRDYYVDVNAFYEGNAYYATTYVNYKDVRLVFAPTKSMGKFGGETDNWMWPRQTCDFSVFRIYVNPKTGGPASYSEKNVPMSNAPFVQVSTEGYTEGDFAMVMGYPGSTERYLSSFGIEEMRNCVNDPMQQVRGVKQQVMKQHMDRSEAVRIKYDSKYAQSSNYWKNAIGMNKCIDSIGIIKMKQDMEQEIARRDTTVDFRLLEQLYKRRAEATRAFTLFAESFTRRSNNELCTRASAYNNGMTLYGPYDKPKKQYVRFDDNSSAWDRDCDVECLAALLRNYREQSNEKYLPDFYNTIDLKFKGDCNAYAAYLWDNTIFMRSGAKIPNVLNKKLQKDLGIMFAMDLLDVLADIRMTLEECNDSIEKQERLLCAAKIRLEEDKPHYSDANFTMRLTYGQVGGYSIGTYNSGYYTTVPSMLEKMGKGNDNADYFAEPEIQALFADSEKAKDLHLCFLTNNDITGGNSGSPVIDGKGRLMGLAFDGNWDSLSADIFFDNALARCINVDIRYVLYIMKHWGKADRLLKEMNVSVND